MAFRDVLLSLVDHAEKKGSEELQRRLDSIAARVARALASPWEDFEKETLTSDAREAGDAARLLRAAEILDQRIITDNRARVLELELGREPAANRARVQELFTGGRVTRRGFVVVAYDERDRKQPVVYVGRGAGVAAVRLGGKSGLGSAALQATQLAFLFPRTGNQSKLKELESSVVLLARYRWGKNPAFNRDAVLAVEESEARSRIEALSDLLESTGIFIHNEAFE